MHVSISGSHLVNTIGWSYPTRMAAPRKWVLPPDPELIAMYEASDHRVRDAARELDIPHGVVYARLVRIGAIVPVQRSPTAKAERAEKVRIEREQAAAWDRAQRARVLAAEYRALTGQHIADPRLEEFMATLGAVLERVTRLDAAVFELSQRPAGAAIVANHRRIVDGGSHPREQRRRARLDAVG